MVGLQLDGAAERCERFGGPFELEEGDAAIVMGGGEI
jgi:hypothetical protein